jgi:hypothetical protein
MKASRGRGGSFFDTGQRAKIIGFDGEHWIELAAKVFERNHRSQFN